MGCFSHEGLDCTTTENSGLKHMGILHRSVVMFLMAGVTRVCKRGKYKEKRNVTVSH